MIKFIADIGSNHCHDIDRAEMLVETAKEIGCWGVKFQLYKADKMYNPKDMPADFKKTELPESWIAKLSELCSRYKIKFGVTPFYQEAIPLLKDYVDFLKIASYEILRLNLIKKCAETGLPLMISTGMASIAEIAEALSICKGNPEIIVYHCSAKYPAKPEQCELKILKIFNETLKAQGHVHDIGWSDHSCESGIIHRAVANGANYIEFHLDLEDGKGAESKHGHCWKPDDIARVIKDVQIGCIANEISLTPVYSSKDKLQRADPVDGMRPHGGVRK